MAKVMLDGLSLKAFRRLFYLSPVEELHFATYEELPPLTDELMIWFAILVAVEVVWSLLRKPEAYRTNDAYTGLGAGIARCILKFGLRTWEYSLYVWCYERFNIIDLPWNSWWTWAVALLLVDFGYYWHHRLSHESHILWAFHQMHHSSEYYNLTTALRQAMFVHFYTLVFYIPMTLLLPPQVVVAHVAVNLVFQFWLHTEVIDRVGPLEWVLNTPSHHRVHHGRNPYCIDKNYAGVLIIWDRLFGTFQPERTDEPIVYGLIHPVNTFNQFYLQTFVFKHALWDKPRALSGWWNRLSSPFRNPGWMPGVGVGSIPPISYPVVKYNRVLPPLFGFHMYLQIIFTLFVYMHLVSETDLSLYQLCMRGSYILFTIQLAGDIFDKKAYAIKLDAIRVTVAAIFSLHYFWEDVMDGSVSLYPGLLTLLWCFYIVPVQFYYGRVFRLEGLEAQEEKTDGEVSESTLNGKIANATVADGRSLPHGDINSNTEKPGDCNGTTNRINGYSTMLKGDLTHRTVHKAFG